jgi:thioesterase domain-containing protein
VNPLDLATAYQQSAVVAAACASGMADAIASEPRSAEAVAAGLAEIRLRRGAGPLAVLRATAPWP